MLFHHVGIVVDDIDLRLGSYLTAFAASQQSEVFSDPLQQAKVVMLAVGSTTLIELVAPLTATSPLAKAASRRAPLHHLCFEVHDLSLEIERLRSLGHITISEPKPAVLFDGRRVAWVVNSSNLLIELLEAS